MSLITTKAPYPNAQHCQTAAKSSKFSESWLSLNVNFDVPWNGQLGAWKMLAPRGPECSSTRVAPSVVTTFTYTE